MRQVYDPQKMIDMVADEARLGTAIQENSDALMQLKESDKWAADDGIMLAKYTRMGQDDARLHREREGVRNQIERYEGTRPLDPNRKISQRSDIMRRWFMGGSPMLDKDEIDDHIGEPTREMIQRNPLMASGGELFHPDGLKMTVGDPTRSDIETGDSAAGLAAPARTAPGIMERLAYFGAVARSAQQIPSDNGNDLEMNQLDTASEEGGAITDQTQAAAGIPGDPDQLNNVTNVTFKSYWRHSKFMDARLESFNDLQFDIAGRIEREAMRRQGRGWNKWFTVGTGTSQPEGVVVAATVLNGGAGSAYDGSGGLNHANLLQMEYGVDLAYLEGDEGGDGGFTDQLGFIGFHMNRFVERGLRGAVDADSRPLWAPALEIGKAVQAAPGRISGWPYRLNQHMDDGQANNDLPIMFGNFYHYGVRNIGGQVFYRFFDSATAAKMSVRFLGLSRRDGRSVGPTVSAKNPALAVLQVKS